MNFKFNKAIDTVAKKIMIPRQEHELFLENVDLIKNEILKKMGEINSLYKDMIVNLEETAFYMKGSSYIDFPINFNSFLKIKMPFDIEPYFQGSSIGETQVVQLCAQINHPIVENGRIRHDVFNFMMSREFMKAIANMGPIKCKDGAVFKLCYEEEESEWIGHTITARENTDLEADDNKIIFSFVPAIMMNKEDNKPLPSWICSSESEKYWFAIPFSGNNPSTSDLTECNYYAINHKWQTVNRCDKIKAKNLLQLILKILRLVDNIVDIDLFVNLRTLIITVVNRSSRESDFFTTPLGSLFMDMLFGLAKYVENRLFAKDPQGTLGGLLLNDQFRQIHLKLHEFHSGQKKYKTQDIKTLFGI